MEPLTSTTTSSPRYTASRQRFGTPVPLLRLDQSGLEQGIERQALTRLASLTASDKGTPCPPASTRLLQPFFPGSFGLGSMDSCTGGASIFVPSAACQCRPIPVGASYSARSLFGYFKTHQPGPLPELRANHRRTRPCKFSLGKAFQIIPVGSTETRAAKYRRCE